MHLYVHLHSLISKLQIGYLDTNSRSLEDDDDDNDSDEDGPSYTIPAAATMIKDADGFAIPAPKPPKNNKVVPPPLVVSAKPDGHKRDEDACGTNPWESHTSL